MIQTGMTITSKSDIWWSADKNVTSLKQKLTFLFFFIRKLALDEPCLLFSNFKCNNNFVEYESILFYKKLSHWLSEPELLIHFYIKVLFLYLIIK